MDIPENMKKLLKKGPMGVTQMAEIMMISRQALHRHLKEMLKNKLVIKKGKGPKVKYEWVSQTQSSRIPESYRFFKAVLLPLYLKKDQKTLPKQYQAHLKKHSLKTKVNLKSFNFMIDIAALYSSKIEGNTLNLNSFLNSRMLPKKHRPKEAEEIEDLVQAYEFTQTHDLSEKNMLKAHKMLSRSFIAPGRQGRYRQEPVGVFSTRGLEYLALEAHLVSAEMKAFFETIITLIKSQPSLPEAFFWASWIHLTMALIHPFVDGNGRIARLCEKWFLKACLGKETYLINSEEYFFLHRPKYYQALKLGVNYWEVDFSKAIKFMELLPGSLH